MQEEILKCQCLDFPRMKKDEKKWVQSCRREDLRCFPVKKLFYYQLHSNHFEDSQFMNKETKSKLMWNEVTTLSTNCTDWSDSIIAKLLNINSFYQFLRGVLH